MSPRTYTVGTLAYSVMAVVGIVLFSALFVHAVLVKEYVPALGFAGFVLFGSYLWASAGLYELTEGAITHRSLFGVFRLYWGELRRVEAGPSGRLVLHGENKRLAVAPPAFWSGSSKAEAFQLLQSQIARPGVVSYPRRFADFKNHKNVRVSGGA